LRNSFNQRANDMGLTSDENKGLYSYSDRYSEVVYRQLITLPSEAYATSNEDSVHETDGQQVPLMAIYTRSLTAVGYTYCGYVSDIYQFIGNDVLNQQIRNAIQEVGLPIITENTNMDFLLTQMRNEIVIQSSQNCANVGDILPVMIVNNSYNGRRAATVAFGISVQHENDRLVFAFNLGEMKQIHIANSNTQMSSVITSYIQVFSNDITDMITSSFQSQLTQDQFLSTLDVIENIGKRRREEISKFLAEMNPSEEGEDIALPSAWQMFLAIVRYSSFEPNLNMKRLLENAAESVLVIPTRMQEVLNRLQSS